MHECPGDPRKESGPVRVEGPAEVCHRGMTPDRCHVALIEVVELFARAAREIVPDRSCGEISHLHGRLCYTRDPFAILLNVSKIAKHEDILVSCRVKSFIDNDAALVIHGQAKLATKRRGLDTGAPKHDNSINALFVDDKVPGLNVLDL